MPITEPDIHVAVGLLVQRDQVLIAKRLPHQHLAGYWEFPGGKIEPGESPRMGLDREILEELGVVVDAAEPFLQVRHSYPEKVVLLDCWLVSRFSQQPEGRDGQEIRWVPIDRLSEFEFPPANVEIAEKLVVQCASV